MNFFTCFWAALKLGLSSFGGPVAHLGYFRQEYVTNRKWIDDERYAELLAICQFLPGPASSQFGAAIGFEKGRWLGALGSWLGFTLPSAILMILFAVGMGSLTDMVGAGWIHGLKLAAFAVVALAVVGLRKKLCPDVPRILLACVAFGALVLAPWTWAQPLIILLGAVVGGIVFADKEIAQSSASAKKKPVTSLVILGLFVVGLCFLPVLAAMGTGGAATAGLLQSGSLVFGGGHVVLPLLEGEFVASGLMGKDSFLAGYGAAQAVPGPMFTLASYLGAAVGIGGNAWLGGLIGTLAIFLPGMILLIAGLPLWDWLKGMPRARGAVTGANAAVVGLLGFALWQMVYQGIFASAGEVVLSLVIFVGLALRKLPVWAAILIAAVLGGFLWR